MATQWSAWLPDIVIDVPGAPNIAIERQVKLTVIDFLERSHWLQRTTGLLDITGGASERSFPVGVVSATERVLKILKAWIDGKPVDVLGPGDVDDDWPDWKTQVGSPQYIVRERDDTYYVVPSPSDLWTGGLRLKVAVGLLETATECDDSIRVEWRDAIAAGAKARLMRMENKPWTDLNLATSYGQFYLDQVSAATLRAIRTPARRPLVTKAHFF
jgi:hypothetical protein